MEIPEFRIEDFTFEEDFLKEGDQANVFKGLHSTHGEVAIKKWFSSSDDMKKEVELLRKNTYHENIIQFLGILIDEQSECIGYVMPFMAMGSLHDAIHNKSKQYDQEQIKSWITKICYGLSYLHDKQIIHRDVKPSNVLLGTSYDDVKLSDFGMVRSLENIQCSLTGGTLFYMAPEVLKEEKYDFSVDVYSLSITIWGILYRRHPYDRATGKIEVITKITQGERPQLNSNLSEEVSDLLKRCWDADASKRPTVDYIREFCSKTTLSLSASKTEKPNENFPEKQTILLVGGVVDESLLLLENNGQNWKKLNMKLPSSIRSHGAQFLNSTIYIFGGENAKVEALNLTYKLSKSLQWEKMADMNQKRRFLSNSSVILNSQVWVCGGWNEEERSLKTVEMYDPSRNEWKYIKQMNQCRGEAAAAVVHGKIFCCGGWDGKKYLNSTECYDPSSDVWTYISDMPRPNGACGIVVMDTHLIVMGGKSSKGKDYLSSVWVLDTNYKHAEWTEASSMSLARSQPSIAKIDDKVFVCGGLFQDSVEIFDGEVWRNGPKMPSPRWCVPAIVIPIEFARSLN